MLYPVHILHEWLSGRALASQAEGRGFESRLVLNCKIYVEKSFRFSGTLIFILLGNLFFRICRDTVLITEKKILIKNHIKLLHRVSFCI